MKRFAWVPLLFALSATLRASEIYEPFRADMPAGAAWSLDASQLHPLQLCLGWREVAAKIAMFDSQTVAEREAYLKKKDVPLVVGPGGVPYITDGHHTMRSLIESRAADQTAFGHVLANWSDLPAAEFWRRIEDNHWTYLKDGKGNGPLPPSALPASLKDLQLDPFRGLAWGVMKAGGFREKKGVFFQEFLWGDFLRGRITWDDSSDASFARAVREACIIAHSPSAAGLPGFVPAPPMRHPGEKLTQPTADALKPTVVTSATRHDTDDPAIWINPADAAASLVIGTDKDTDGALYAFDLEGRVVKRVGGLKRPNNVDVIDGFKLGGNSVAIAVTTEREEQRLRVFTVPALECVDRGDLVVFDGDRERAPMGVALYKRPGDGVVFAIVGGKSGPAEGYLAQYRIEDDGTGRVKMTLVRTFGHYSGNKEIEAIAVDADLGFVYYSDETVGVRKYRADPDSAGADEELALFGTAGFAGDHEGIAIYKHADGTGWIVVSDQQADRFQLFPREGIPGDANAHPLIASVDVSAIECDGCEIASVPLGPNFPRGALVAMSNGRVFHYYAWDDLAKAAGLE